MYLAWREKSLHVDAMHLYSAPSGSRYSVGIVHRRQVSASSSSYLPPPGLGAMPLIPTLFFWPFDTGHAPGHKRAKRSEKGVATRAEPGCTPRRLMPSSSCLLPFEPAIYFVRTLKLGTTQMEHTGWEHLAICCTCEA